MADEKAKRDFSDILKHLNTKFDITDCKWKEQKLFEIKFRTQIRVDSDDYNSYCDEWVNKFSHVTNTVWVNKISNTGPKVKFRKQYQCWPYREKEVKNELLFDARKCRATLDVKILGDSSYTKKKNKHMRLGLNGLVKVPFLIYICLILSKVFYFRSIFNIYIQLIPTKTALFLYIIANLYLMPQSQYTNPMTNYQS